MAIKLVESYSVQLARNSVRDSLQSHGEECIALSMYHVNADEKIQQRCPICFDDTYKQPDPQCNYCYGTTFKGGIKYATRMWAMFADTSKVEAIRERGVWVPDAREMQCEAFPLFMERDYVVRVRKWTSDHRPLEIEGYYAIGQGIVRNSIRTGNRFGQWTWDVIGQRANVSELQRNSIICQFPVVNVEFPDTRELSATVGPNVPVFQPDTKVVFYPSSGLAGSQVLTHIQNGPSEEWLVTHNFDHFPAVTVVVGGEQVDADISYPDSTTVRIGFAAPQVGTAELM